jgi:mannose-6-phosphate isomerase-like protein (cupin superfamily)
MIIIHADEVEAWWTPPPHHRELKILLTPEKNDVSNLLSMGMVVLPPGESGDPHTHGAEQEAWFVVSGHGKLIVGGETAELKPDMVIVAPSGIEHQIINDGDEPLKALFLFSPAGPEAAYVKRDG